MTLTETAAQTLSFVHDGRSVSITRPSSLNPRPSFFAVGLPKAGSTLLDNLMRRVCAALDLPVFALDVEAHALGLKPRDLPAEVLDLFAPAGFGYLGFRTVPVAGLPPFADGRTVALVRDPRDMVVSHFFSLGFSHTPPGTAAGDAARAAFEAERQRIQQETIDAWVLGQAQVTMGLFNRLMKASRSRNIRIWRYEDVIFNKLSWAREMLDHLDLPLDPVALDEIVAAVDIRPASENPARHIRRVTPGDHIEKLTPETIRTLDTVFAPALEAFGYPRSR